MRVIDARSGKTVQIGETIEWRTGWCETHGPTWIRLLNVRPDVFRASAVIQRGDRSRSETVEIPLVVRWLHPSYFLQHVAFLPT
jgi:hypothetical protein